jgi:hypothetical protein
MKQFLWLKNTFRNHEKDFVAKLQNEHTANQIISGIFDLIKWLIFNYLKNKKYTFSKCVNHFTVKQVLLKIRHTLF